MRDSILLRAGALFLSLQACGPAEPPPPDVYELRGVVRQLPSSGSPGSALLIRHETVPDFEDADGEVVGMVSMTMPFAVADEELLADLRVGDKITATFEVRWQGKDPLRITAMEKLPPETVLAFEPSDDEPQKSADEASAHP